jgi:hypothetical protein
MKLKTLIRQYEEFEARQARKAERERAKVERDAARADRQRRWVLMKETQRKTRERKARASDAAQQRRLDDCDAVYVEGSRR